MDGVKDENYYANVKLIPTQMIHCEVQHRETMKKMNISCVYGFNDKILRRKLWKDIVQAHGQLQGP